MLKPTLTAIASILMTATVASAEIPLFSQPGPVATTCIAKAHAARVYALKWKTKSPRVAANDFVAAANRCPKNQNR